MRFLSVEGDAIFVTEIIDELQDFDRRYSSAWTVGINGTQFLSLGSSQENFPEPNRPDPRRILADATHVYWLELGDKSLYRTLRGGGVPQEVITTDVYDFGLRDDAIYWAQESAQTIWLLAKSGGSPSKVVEYGSKILELVADNSGAYWINTSGELLHVSAYAGDNIEKLTQEPCSALRDLTLDSSHVYWTYRGSGAACYQDRAIRRISKGGGPVENIAEGQLAGQVTNIAVDQNSVYWSYVGGTLDWGIRKIPKIGGSSTLIVAGAMEVLPVSVLATISITPTDLAVDSTHLYWTDGPVVAKVAK